MKNSIVAGATGLVGSHILQKLADHGDRPLALVVGNLRGGFPNTYPNTKIYAHFNGRLAGFFEDFRSDNCADSQINALKF